MEMRAIEAIFTNATRQGRLIEELLDVSRLQRGGVELSRHQLDLREVVRGAILIVNLDDPAKVPVLAEPWFLTFNANVQFRIVMTPDDLKRAGLDELGKKW